MGFLVNQRMQAVKPSATIGITMRARELNARGIKVVSLAAGEPDFDTPEHIKEAAIRALREGKTKYMPSAGIPELREAIAAKLQRENGLQYSPQQIVVGCGAKHSLYNIFQVVLEPGDEVIIPSPYWVSYPELVTLAGGRPVIVPTEQENEFRLRPEQLAAAITPRTRAFILNSPSNPTGMGYDCNQQQSLAEVLREHPRIAIVSDEIYELLTYRGFRHVSFAAAAPDLYERTFTVNGFSKTFSMTGWRLGYVACPDRASAEAIQCLQEQSTTGTTSFAQYGALAALQGSVECVARMRAAFDERRAWLVEALRKIPGVSCLDPQGAFYVFPNISAWGIPSTRLCLRLLEEAHIAPVPGASFGADGHIRISFATSLEQLKEAVKRLRAWVGQHIGQR
ncbi:MAG: pyridoxal phosphate-dependent aminotransferase [bacterium]|nr:pyridoxal phosphate-dependent aminotransferase [bacterium]